MKPPPFSYHDPKTVSEGVGLLGTLDNAKLLAGGQSLMPMLNMRFVLPDHIIDLNRVEGLSYIREAKGTLEIGAMTRQRDLEFSDAVRVRWPIMHEALLQIRPRQARDRGTIGGSLCHLDPAAELVSLATGYDAPAPVAGPGGEGELPFAEFPVAYMTPAIELNELVVGVRFPQWPAKHGYAFVEFSRRHGDFAITSAAVLLEGDASGKITRASVTIGGMGTAPTRARDVEQAIVGQGGAERFSLRRRRKLPQARSDRRRARASVLSPAFGGGAVAAGVREGACALARCPRGPSALGVAMGEKRKIALTVNGKRYEEEVEVRVTLADFIRHQLGLTGTHLGCGPGVCGPCTILFDDRSARSCLMLAVQADGHDILTVEGIAPSPDKLHPLQQAFHEHHGLQCGFCTPGSLTTLIEFLRDNPDPTEQEVRIAIAGNLCRCTGYQNIVTATL